jgi:hypothetical protein
LEKDVIAKEFNVREIDFNFFKNFISFFHSGNVVSGGYVDYWDLESGSKNALLQRVAQVLGDDFGADDILVFTDMDVFPDPELSKEAKCYFLYFCLFFLCSTISFDLYLFISSVAPSCFVLLLVLLFVNFDVSVVSSVLVLDTTADFACSITTSCFVIFLRFCSGFLCCSFCRFI